MPAAGRSTSNAECSLKALKPCLPSQQDLDALSEDEDIEGDGESTRQGSGPVDDETLTAEQVEAQLNELYPLQPNSVPQSLSQVPCIACPFYSDITVFCTGPVTAITRC